VPQRLRRAAVGGVAGGRREMVVAGGRRVHFGGVL